ncbi:MAG: glycosyl transferase, partial [Candidatus Pacearchaeota archaeon]|nr:glycosyl transferase [Candidatus Pacearchaeota archaeon]
MGMFSVYLTIAVVTWLLTGLLRRYAISRSVMDIPNERSSHSTPTPRGGGIAIVIIFLIGLAYLWGMLIVEDRAFVALLGAGLGVAVIGFMDDHAHIAARWRLLAHFSSAGWIIFWLGGFPPLLLFGYLVDLGWAGHLLAVVYLVWLLNLYNF